MHDKTGKMKTEANISNDAAMEVSKCGGKSFRNNVGGAWAGQKVRQFRENGSVFAVIKDPYRINFGLQVGSGDRIGWLPVKITPEMVGMTIAQFMSLEMKKMNGTASPDQIRWHEIVLADGGLSGFIRDKSDVARVINGDRLDP